MKIGLLVCDQVKPEYQAEFGDYPDMFAALFPDYQFENYKVFQGEFPKKVTDCPVYMATGSVHSVYEDLDWIRQTKAFIKEIYHSKSYFIGVCFGHQLMAEALGGKVEKALGGWCVGIHEFNILQIKHWMRPARSSVNFLMLCQDQVVQLPPNGIRLAGNADCPNAMMQVGNRMLSIQAHPEFSRAYDQQLVEDRIERVGAEKVEKAIASLKQPIDTSLFREWVQLFLKGID